VIKKYCDRCGKEIPLNSEMSVCADCDKILDERYKEESEEKYKKKLAVDAKAKEEADIGK